MYIIPEHLIGKMPCIWCGNPVTIPSMDGPGVCTLCDCGLIYDEHLKMVRKWDNSDAPFKRYMKGKPCEAFLKAIGESL